jgi:hypothetical protein
VHCDDHEKRNTIPGLMRDALSINEEVSRIHHPSYPSTFHGITINKFHQSNIKQPQPDSAYPSSPTKKHSLPAHFHLPKSVHVKPVPQLAICRKNKKECKILAAPTLTAVPDEHVSRVPRRELRAFTAMTERLSVDRSSEEMSVATKSSFAVAENRSSPIHSVQAALAFWRPGRVKLEARRKAPAMRAVVRVEVQCCPGIRRERARSGIRYGRWAERLIPEVI